MPVTDIQPHNILVPISREDVSEKNIAEAYTALCDIDLIEAFRFPDPAYSIGLKLISRTIEALLPPDRQPDLLFVETSLFPAKIRDSDKITDFLHLRVPQGECEEEVLNTVAAGCDLVYETLHQEQCSIYFIPSFFQKAQGMRMYWSEYKSEGTPYNHQRSVVVDLKDRERAKREKVTLAAKTANEDSKSTENRAGWKKVETGTYQRVVSLDSRKSTNKRAEEDVIHVEEAQIHVDLFHSLFHQYVLQNLYAQSFVWCIPIIGAATESKADYLTGLGAIFVVAAYKQANDLHHVEAPADNPPCDLAKAETKGPAGEDWIRQIGVSVSYLMKDIFSPHLYTTVHEKSKEAFSHALRAALSAIVARNMSHNTGSHGFAHILGDTLQPEGHDAQSLQDYLDEVKNFLSYAKGRMDFVAEVTTYWREIPWLNQLTL